MASYTWDFSFIYRSLPMLMDGLLGTFYLFAAAMITGMLLGLFVGVARTSQNWAPRSVAVAYVFLFRNTPGLIQIIWVFYALPIVLGVQSPPWLAAYLALSLYTGAYCGEIYRAGIESVERSQWEAARALGMTRSLMMRDIILPQAIRRMVPAFANRAIELFKATTLASTLAYSELLHQAKILAEYEFRPIETYTVVAIIYTAAIMPIFYFQKYLERRAMRRS